MRGKVGFISLGCAKNLVNSEQMMYLLNEAGFEVTGETEGADAVVVNTCAFIESAKTEAIETIINLGTIKKEGRIGKIIAAGCLAERYKDEMLSEMPEIDVIVGTGAFDDIDKAIETALDIPDGQCRGFFGDINAPVSEADRIITTSPVWAYLKIAEGCDNKCAYCVIPGIRGRFRSRPIENVVNEAWRLAGCGIKELIIVAQDVTRYGLDIYGKHRLADLLKELCDISDIKWIRLLYLYPDEINEELIDVIATSDKILKYLDIPVQHINDDILRNMNRRYTSVAVRALISRLRERIPGVALRTSIIAGLPGESEKEFDELGDFLREEKIERAGIFPYSPEEGTPAALMDRPDADTAAHRAEILVDIQSRVMDEFNKNRVGSITTVLVESYDGKRYYGRSFAESPDVDGYIVIEGNGLRVNDFIDIRITRAQDGELVAEPAANS